MPALLPAPPQAVVVAVGRQAAGIVLPVVAALAAIEQQRGVATAIMPQRVPGQWRKSARFSSRFSCSRRRSFLFKP